jgi:hypothetical protein
VEPKTFIRVEYDPNFCGGNYSGVGKFVLLPSDTENVEEAFEKKTGLPHCCIVHYSEDELYDEDGNSFYGPD